MNSPPTIPLPATIHVRVADFTGAPVAGVPAADFRIVPGTSTFPRLCGGFRSANADHATDARHASAGVIPSLHYASRWDDKDALPLAQT